MKPTSPFISPAIATTLDVLFGTLRQDERPSWDTYFLAMAKLAATRATCPRASVGCVLVRDKHVLTTGYNGASAGLDSCLDVGCMVVDGHCLRSVHAEANAIIQAALHGVTTAGCTAYVTHTPCVHCSKMLINAGVWRVVYSNEYLSAGVEFFKSAGVKLERIGL